MGAATNYYSTPGTYSFELPWGAELKTLRCWGPGGCGANTSNPNTVGGGGGGGAYAAADSTSMTPYAGLLWTWFLDITVGAGGTSGLNSPESTQISVRPSTLTFGNGTLLVKAGGGNNVSANSSIGGSGGTVLLGSGYSGGNGANGSAGTYSGGGGGGAGDGAIGGNASTYVGGTGGASSGGNGGNGRNASVGNGTNGTAAGGGGGGSIRGGSGSFTGGSGASGLAYIEVLWPDNVVLFVPENNPL